MPIAGYKLKHILEGDVRSSAWKARPQLVVCRASTKLIDDEKSTVLKESIIRNKYKVLSDEPEDRGGADKAPAPIEHMIASFGQCLVTVYAYHSALNDLSLEGVEVDAKGYIDQRGVYDVADVTRGLTKVRYTTRISSGETEEKIKWLVDVVEKCCPAHATLRRACPLEGEIFLNGKKLMTVKHTP